MREKGFKRFFSCALWVLLILVTTGLALADSTTVIYSFAGGADGAYPETELAFDPSDILLGTTVMGGNFEEGTIFELVPSGDTWTHTVLYHFTGGPDGGQPYQGVARDSQGNYYGTTLAGGIGGSCEGGCGVVYKLSQSGGVWSQTVIYNFTGGEDGGSPISGVTIDGAGDIFGVTPIGGQFGFGAIYQLRPEADGTYRFRVIHAFTGGSDGASGSNGRLLLFGNNLYGVATNGGDDGFGTVFKLTRTGSDVWSFHTLYSFTGMADGGNPTGSLDVDAHSNMFGTTYSAGAHGFGTVFRYIVDLRPLYGFNGETDGSRPVGTITVATFGSLLGTASEGGSPTCSCGTIFGINRNGLYFVEGVVHKFQGAPTDGATPLNGMTSNHQHNLFGTTVKGGLYDQGTIYRLGL